MIKSWLVALTLSAWWAYCPAQTAGGNIDTVQTVAGPLVISKVDRVGADSVTYTVRLAGHDFDKLYGMRYAYYTESGSSDEPNARVLMEDFIGGAADTPAITLYDFGKKRPEVVQITDKLDVEDVRWKPGAVLLQADDQWYEYKRGKLSRLHSRPK